MFFRGKFTIKALIGILVLNNSSILTNFDKKIIQILIKRLYKVIENSSIFKNKIPRKMVVNGDSNNVAIRIIVSISV